MVAGKFESAPDTPEQKPRVYFCFAPSDRSMAEAIRDALSGEIDPSHPDQFSSADDDRYRLVNTDIVILIATDEARHTVGDQLRQAMVLSKAIIVVQLDGTALASWEPIDDALLTHAVVPLTSSTLTQDFVEQLSNAISLQWREILKTGAAVPDDLKRIRGIGVLIEKKLNALGVTRYEHIANWSSADIDRISNLFEFKGRIERENWIEQAKNLAGGGETEFSKQVDRPTVSTEIAPPPTRISVFVSSAAEDREEAALLVQRLKPEDLEVYWDERFDLGEHWKARTDSRRQNADAIVVLFSANALASSFVRDDAEFAHVHQNIVPVLARSFSASLLPPPFQDLRAAKIDDVLADPRSVVQAIERSADDRRALNKLTPREAEIILSEKATAEEQSSEQTARQGYVPFAKLKKIVEASAAVVAIQDAAGRTIGDGFLVEWPMFGSGLNTSASHVLTSAQLIWDSSPSHQPRSGNALAPDEVRIVTNATTADGVTEVYRCARVVWQSRPDKLNAVLIELDRPALNIQFLPIVLRLSFLRPSLLSNAKVMVLARASSLSAINSGTVIANDDKSGVFSYPVGNGDVAVGCPVLEEENLRVVGIHQSMDSSNPPIGRTVFIRSIVNAVRQQLAILSLARDWRASGEKKSRLLKAAQLKGIDAQIRDNPLSPWMASEIEPFLTASRRTLMRSTVATRRAFAAALAALPLIAGVAADRWIANVSVALSPPPNSAVSSRIDNFLNPSVSTNEGPMRAARNSVRQWLSPGNAHQSAIRDLVLTRDGKFAAVLSADNTVKLWDLDAMAMKWQYRVAEEFEGLVLGLDYSNAKTSVLLFSLDIDTSNDKPGSMTPQRMYGDTTAIDIETGVSEKKPDFEPTLQLRRARLPASADPDFSPGMVLSASQTEFGNTLKGYADGTIAVNGTEAEKAMKHTSSVRAVATSDDGALAASAAADGSAILWTKPVSTSSASVAAWTAIALEPASRLSPVSSIMLSGSADRASPVLSPDGSRVVSTDGEQLRLWESKTGSLLCSANARVTEREPKFSFDGARIVSIGDGSAIVWDTATCQRLLELRGHKDQVSSAAFSPDGTKVATSSHDNSARLWDRDGRELLTLSGHTAAVFDVVFSPDGTKLLTASDDKTASLWDVATGRQLVVLRGHDDGITSIAISPDGRTIATGSKDQSARIWDAASGAEIAQLQGHTSWVLGVKYSPDGRKILTTADDQTAMLWDASTHKLIATLKNSGAFAKADFSADGRFIYSYAQSFSKAPPHVIGIFDAETGRELANYVAVVEISSARFVGDHLLLVEGPLIKRIALTRSSCGGPCSAASFAKDGKFLVTSGWGGKAQIWSTSGASKGRLLAELNHGDAINNAVFVERVEPNAAERQGTPEAPARVITVGDDGTAKLWQLTGAAEGVLSPSLVATIRGHDAPITHAELTPDAQTLVTGDMRGKVRKTDLAASVLLSKVDVTPAIENYVVPTFNFASGSVESLGRRGWAVMTAVFPQTVKENEKSDLAYTPPQSTDPASSLSVPNLTNEEITKLVSPEARQMVIGYEVTSQNEYERKYAGPLAPAGDSGITIGIGYDVGYVTEDQLANNWGGLLPDATIARLKRAVGVKGDGARAMLGDLRDIRVPWDAAVAAFERATIPRFGRLVLGLFPNAKELHPHSFGALFSLVYNRGTSLQGERRQEMRNIRDYMAAREFEKIPNEFRAMKRLWSDSGLPALQMRRDAEAAMFERGLASMSSGSAQSAPQSAPMPQGQ